MAFRFHKKNESVSVRNGAIKDCNLLKKKLHFRTVSRLLIEMTQIFVQYLT